MPQSAGRMLASKIAYCVRNSAGIIYPSLVSKCNAATRFSAKENCPNNPVPDAVLPPHFHPDSINYWVAKPSRNLGFISWVFLLFFSVSGNVLPVTPLLSGVFVHRVFCAYFVRFEGAGVMRSLLCTINL